MTPQALRQTVLEKPFRTVRIRLQSGEPILVTHPENIGIANALVVVTEGPEAPYLFEPASVVAVDHPKTRSRR